MVKETDIDLLLRNVKANHEKLNEEIVMKKGIALKEFIMVRKTDRNILGGKIVLGEKGDFKGIYVFIYKDEPIYVGISRTVLRRLRQHLYGKDGSSASLANRIAKEKCRAKSKLDDYRNIEQEKLRKMKVILLNVYDDYEMYMLEVYSAFKWKCKHNSFRTH